MTARVIKILMFLSLNIVAADEEKIESAAHDEESPSSCFSHFVGWVFGFPDEGIFEREWGPCGICGQEYDYRSGDIFTHARVFGPVGCCAANLVSGTASSRNVVERIGPCGCVFTSSRTKDEYKWSVCSGCLMNYHEAESPKPFGHRFQCAPCGVCFEHKKNAQMTECDFLKFLCQVSRDDIDHRTECRVCFLSCCRQY